MTVFDLENVELQRKRDFDYRLRISKFYLDKGELIALVGPSGCGKSTALDILGMALKPTSVERFIFSPDNQSMDVGKLWKGNQTDRMAYLRSLYLGYVLQTGELLPFLNVEDNIRLTASIKGLESPQTEILMKELGIVSLRRSMPKTLSIGERQRVAICRALVSQPKVIFADEPTAALDPLMAKKVMGLLVKTVREAQAALVVVTHDIRLAEEFGFNQVPVRVEMRENSVSAFLNRVREEA
ncbi:ABC transporter ATP-binding protein [Parasutterella sp.]|uniref:ABC transporter ATP-binding protein n=1 Tax=Parasutterella sp. TaxID=2049037 RepID=UPI003AB88A0B